MRYRVIESKHWEHPDGRTASIYGCHPDYTDDNWKIVIVGYTIKDKQTGRVGTGRPPYKTYTEADDCCHKLNSRA